MLVIKHKYFGTFLNSWSQDTPSQSKLSNVLNGPHFNDADLRTVKYYAIIPYKAGLGFKAVFICIGIHKLF